MLLALEAVNEGACCAHGNLMKKRQIQVRGDGTEKLDGIKRNQANKKTNLECQFPQTKAKLKNHIIGLHRQLVNLLVELASNLHRMCRTMLATDNVVSSP